MSGKMREIWLDSWFNPFFLVKKRGRMLLEKESGLFKGVVLDIGCRDKPFYSIFKERVNRYIGIDIDFNTKWRDKIDCLADGRNLPFRKNSLDNVISSYALGDNEEPQELMAEISRVLKKDGYLFLMESQWWPLHDEPFDYWRFTKYSLRYLAERHSLKVIKIEPIGGIYLSLGIHLNYYLFYHWGLKNSFLLGLMLPLYLLIQIVACIFDSVHRLDEDTSGYLMVAQKI